MFFYFFSFFSLLYLYNRRSTIYTSLSIVYNYTKSHGIYQTASYAKRCIYDYSKNKVVAFFNLDNFNSSRHSYEISYEFNGTPYKIINNKSKTKFPVILKVTNEKGEDITEMIKTYAGPFNDFHFSNITPSNLDQKELTFDLMGGRRIVVLQFQRIIYPLFGI
jgi:hypothetical protein